MFFIYKFSTKYEIVAKLKSLKNRTSSSPIVERGNCKSIDQRIGEKLSFRNKPIDFVQTFGKSKEKTDFSFQKQGNYFEVVFPRRGFLFGDSFKMAGQWRKTDPLHNSPVAFLSRLKTGVIGQRGCPYNR